MMKICPQCFDRYEDAVAHCAKESTTLLGLGDPGEAPLIGSIAAGRFLLLDVLGAGGMGTVYLAYQLTMARHVAVKVLTAKGPPDVFFAERFIREAKCAAQLRSPHTITVHDFGQLDNGDPFLAMELLSGPTLEEVIWRDRNLQPDRAMRLVEEMCMSLEEAHALGMIHRDIKPRNIIIEDEGTDRERLKLLDFGLVMLTQPIDGDQARLTRPGVIHGSPAYMAPEMWSEQFGAVGPGTDVYALGCVMVEMLTGALLFHGRTIPQFMCQHVFDPVPALPGAADDPLLGALDRVVRKCLEKRPGDRYPDVHALRTELQALRANPPRAEPVESSPTALPAAEEPRPPLEEWGYAQTIPAATTDPRVLAVRLPKRDRQLLLAASLLAAIAVLGAALAVQVPEQAETAPLAVDDSARGASDSARGIGTRDAAALERGASDHAVARVPDSARVSIEAPARAPGGLRTATRALSKRSSRVRLSALKTVLGALDAGDAESVLDKLSPELARCFERGKLTLRIFVRPDGTTSAVRVTPPGPQTCIERAVATKPFAPFVGDLSVLSVVVER